MASEKERRCLITEHNGILKTASIDSTHFKHAVLRESQLEKTTVDDRSTDIFGPVEGNSGDSEEEEEEEEPEEKQEKTRLVASSKREEKFRKINQTTIRGVHYAKKWGRISKNSKGTKSSSSWIGENPKPVPIISDVVILARTTVTK